MEMEMEMEVEEKVKVLGAGAGDIGSAAVRPTGRSKVSPSAFLVGR
jgi:hypothetical protein